ncbi:MAG TPA: hypothetical protein VHH15_19645 [Actinophytocola sp.]|nr:hypothetical protein [Actinophytocola sp.]
MASTRNQSQLAAACEIGAQKLARHHPRRGVRLENMGQFLRHVLDDLVRSVQHWRQVYSTRPPADD